MGGRGGESMTGMKFNDIVWVQVTQQGFQLTELQKLILELAALEDSIEKNRADYIIAQAELDVPGIEALIQAAADNMFKESKKGTKKIHSKSSLLRKALNFWKAAHGGLLPPAVQAFFDDPLNRAQYLEGSQNFSNLVWTEMTAHLGKFGQWLNLVLADEIMGLPMPADFSDFE